MPFACAPELDARLAAHAGAGDDDAFSALHARHHARLVVIAERVLPGGADAEGAVQDAWIRAHRALGDGKRPANVAAWLSTIVRNVCLDDLDRIAARPASAGPTELDTLPTSRSSDPADAVIGSERLRDVLDDLEALPERQRSALTRHVFGGEACEDVGKAMQLDTGAVKALIYRARLQLRARRARRLREDPAYGAVGVAWPFKTAVVGFAALAGGAAVGAISQRAVINPPRAPAWVAPGQVFVSHAIAPGGRLPRGLALVHARVPLTPGVRARRQAVTVRCPAGHVVVDWMRPAALDPDVVWASFDGRAQRRRYAVGATAPPTAVARIAYAPLSGLPAGRALTFSVLCARRTAARDAAVGASP